MAQQHHIRLEESHLEGNQGMGRYVLLPGDRARAQTIAKRFQKAEAIDNPRGLTAWLGTLESGVDVLSISSGIGCPSLEVVVHELMACGARRLIRVGSCGSLVPEIIPGQVIIAHAAVRDETTTTHYVPPEFPAVSHPDAVSAMVAGAKAAGLAEQTFMGICHSKSSLYAREFGFGPAKERNQAYQEGLKRAGVIASEMEASALFVLATTASAGQTTAVSNSGDHVQAACVLGVFGTHTSNMKLDPEAVKQAEQRAIDVALSGVQVWAERDEVL